MIYETAEETYNSFWKALVETDGEIDIEQVKKELHDFYFVMSQVSRVYDECTGGQLSKPHYFADAVIQAIHEYFDMCARDEIDDNAELGIIQIDLSSPDLWERIESVVSLDDESAEGLHEALMSERLRGNV